MFKHLLNHHTPLERKLEKVAGDQIESLHAPIREIHDPEKCPTELLPWLAWERSVDYWRDDWPEQIKRDVIAASVDVHRKKGTLSAVRQAIALTGLQAEVSVPKHLPDYVPHTFKVTITPDYYAQNPVSATEIAYQIDHVKPARCGYEIGIHDSLDNSVKLATVGILDRLQQHHQKIYQSATIHQTVAVSSFALLKQEMKHAA